MLYLEVKARGTVQNFLPIISSSFVAEFAVSVLCDTQYSACICIELVLGQLCQAFGSVGAGCVLTAVKPFN